MSAEMLTDEDFKALNIKAKDGLSAEERLGKIKAAAKDHLENPQIKIEELAATYGIPRRTLYYYFKKLGIIQAGDKERVSVAERAIRKTEIGALTEEAEKIATIAIRIGGVIARQYLPLINHLMSKGRTLEMIAVDIMAWYEMKIPTETRIAELEIENEGLDKMMSKLKLLSMPNIQYVLRAKMVEDFTNKLARARMRGTRIKIAPAVRALNLKLIEIGKMEDM